MDFDADSIKEDQSDEMQVLESMYEKELEVLSEDPHTFNIYIFAKIDEEAATSEAGITLRFTFTKTYPHEAPLYEVVSSEHLDKSCEYDIIEMMDKSVDSYLGIVMIYNFIIEIQDKITEILEVQDTGRKMEILRIEKEQFDLDQKKFEGEIVTIESFLNWKKKFNSEMENANKKQIKGTVKENKKLTGKELFMTDLTMDDSDVKFFEQEDENEIEIDEALFDDTDDIYDLVDNVSD